MIIMIIIIITIKRLCQSGVNRGQQEHTGSFSGYPKKGVGAVFS